MLRRSRSPFRGPIAFLLTALFAAGCPCDKIPGPSDGGTPGPDGGGLSDGGGDAGARPDGGGGPDGGAVNCEPNLTEKCGPCPGLGSRRCAPDGRGWSACECASYGAELAVSPSGDDAAAGTLAAPFKTLGRAQLKVAELVAAGLPAGGLVVYLREGVYELKATLALGPAESGSDAKPVVWRGYPGERARLLGGTRLSPSAFTKVASTSPVYSRLDPAARGTVVEVSLPAQGVTSYGALTRRGFCGAAAKGPLELVVGGVPMTLARWPDASQNDPPPTNPETASALDLYGAPSPDISGHYVKTGTQDGMSSFDRQGLAGGLQYHLYRSTWTYQGQTYTAWFLTTDASGYPSGAHPFWYRYDPKLGQLLPSNGGVGELGLRSLEAVNHGFASIAEAVSDRVWRYSGDRPSRWANPSEVWFHGFWKYSWADCHVPPVGIDVSTKTVTFSDPPGYGLTAGQPYYAYNLPEEITTPGEYWIDRTTGSLYLWPPGGFATAEVQVTLLESPLVSLDGASFVEVRDLTLEAGRAELVRIAGGTRNRLVGLTLRNGGTGAGSITGTENLALSCNVYGTGNGGFELSGGDRPSLTPGKNAVENSHFEKLDRWEWTYRPAVLMWGDGNLVRNNTIHDLPHTAILFSGSEHQIERNEIHHVCQFSSDAGGIYVGRDWGARGNLIRHNFIHHMATWFEGFGLQAIYLDDCASGIRVEGNVLYEISGHGIQHGGGRDALLLNNVIARSGGALTADDRCFSWFSQGVPNDIPGDSWNLLEKLRAVDYQKDPWASRWPECAAIPNDWAAISSPPSHWLKPEGSVLSRNVGFGNGTWADASADTLADYASISDNLENTDPLFVDEANLDLSLKPSSPAYGLPGFERIPFETIGVKP